MPVTFFTEQNEYFAVFIYILSEELGGLHQMLWEIKEEEYAILYVEKEEEEGGKYTDGYDVYLSIRHTVWI